MKNIILNNLKISVVTAIINFALASWLGDRMLDTPFMESGSLIQTPALNFAIMSAVMTIVLCTFGALLLGFLSNKSPEKGVKIWLTIGIAVLVLFGIMPFILTLVTTSALILVNILHLVAGLPILYLLPKKL